MATERRSRLSLRKWKASPCQMVPSTPVCPSTEKAFRRDKEAVVPQILAHDFHSPSTPGRSSGVRAATPAFPVLELSTPRSHFSPSPASQPSPRTARVLVPDTPDTRTDTEMETDAQIVPSVATQPNGRQLRRARADSILRPIKSSRVPILNLFDFSTDYDIFALPGC